MAETAAPTSPPPPPPENPTPPKGDAGAPGRPAWLPEQYETPEAFRAAHDELRTKFSSKTDALKADLTKELETARLAKRPESPDKYEVKAPKGVVVMTEDPAADFQPEAGKTYVRLDTKDPMFQWWRQTAHDLGLDNAGFNKGVELYLQNVVGKDAKAAETAKAEHDALMKELGDQPQARIEHLFKGLEAKLGPDVAKALDDAYVSKASIEALETVLDRLGGPKFSPETAAAGSDGAVALEAQARKIMTDKDYYSNPQKQKQVADLFAKAYPNGAVRKGLSPFARSA